MSAPTSPDIPTPPSSVDEALGVLFTLGAGALHARRCSLYLRTDDGAGLVLRQDSGLPAREEAALVLSEGTVAGLVMRTRVPLLVKDTSAYPALPVHPERYNSHSFISVPILVENEAMGVLNVAEREDGAPFSENDLQSAELVARSIAAVLHSDLLAQRAAGEAEIDPATGLYNARHFAKRLAQEVERAQRARLPLSLLLLEVSCYADVARRVDVQTAGRLMRCVGEMVAETVRQSDVLAHRADGEIAVLLPSTPLDRARRVARAIVREVRHEKLPPVLRYDCESLSVGIGLAALERTADADALLYAAEEALARARAQGDAIVAASGNEVVMPPPRAWPEPAHHEAIATALRLGIPYLSDPADASMPEAVRLLDAETARTYASFPVAFEAGTLTLAMADPTDARAIQAVSDLTGMAVYPVASPREKIVHAIATLMSEDRDMGGPHTGVRLSIAATTDRRLFMQQTDRLADACAALAARSVTFEGTITAQPPITANRAALVAALAAIPDLSLQRDTHDPFLLHTLEPAIDLHTSEPAIDQHEATGQ